MASYNISTPCQPFDVQGVDVKAAASRTCAHWVVLCHADAICRAKCAPSHIGVAVVFSGLQLTMFDTPMTQRQIEYLRKVHMPVIQEHNVTQRHYDIMVSYLLEAMRTNGAQVRGHHPAACVSSAGKNRTSTLGCPALSVLPGACWPVAEFQPLRISLGVPCCRMTI